MSIVSEDWRRFLEQRVVRRRSLAQAYEIYASNMADANLPIIFDFPDLAEIFGLDPSLMASVITKPELFYHHFHLRKRSGGERLISVPSPMLLSLQRWIGREILSKIALHDSAHGFVSQRSIVSNALPHLGAECVLKMDISDFFGSISKRRGVAIFKNLGYPGNVSYFLASLCFLKDGLPQGAPTSPVISNIVARRMDARIAGFARVAKLRYTRYSDDITLSGVSLSKSTVGAVANIIKDEGFRVNERKTRLIRGDRKKIVTGISVGGDKLRLPRESVRQIKSAVHNLEVKGYWSHFDLIGEYDPIYIERLRGKLSFWHQIDPEHTAIPKLRASLDKVEESLRNELLAIVDIGRLQTVRAEGDDHAGLG